MDDVYKDPLSTEDTFDSAKNIASPKKMTNESKVERSVAGKRGYMHPRGLDEPTPRPTKKSRRM